MEERAPSPIDKLTIPGRLLLIGTILLFGLGFYWSFLFFGRNFPPGRYPIIFVCMPVFIVCFFFFVAGAWLLERLGVQVYAKKIEK